MAAEHNGLPPAAAAPNNGLPPLLPDDPFLAAAAQWCALGAGLYALLFFLSSRLSPRLFSRAFSALPAGDRADWHSRVPSTVHAVASVAWAGALIFGGAFSGGSGGEAGQQQQQQQQQERFGGPTAGAEPEGWPSLRACTASFAALGLSAGYFSADAAAMALFPAIGSAPIYAHHAVALASLAAAALARGAHAPVLAVLASEATTPFVNARFWLDRCGHRKGFLYAANGLALALAWFACREVAFVGYAVWMRRAWPGVVEAGLPAYARAMLCGVPALLTVLNTLWFFKILRGARKLWPTFCEGLAAAARRWTGPRAAGKSVGGGGGGGGARRRPSVLPWGGSHGGGSFGGAHASATITTTARPDAGGEKGGKALRHHNNYHHTRVDVVAAGAAE